jgi:hypothetical protein
MVPWPYNFGVLNSIKLKEFTLASLSGVLSGLCMCVRACVFII